jgi:hypothetical protein
LIDAGLPLLEEYLPVIPKRRDSLIYNRGDILDGCRHKEYSAASFWAAPEIGAACRVQNIRYFGGL